jgi:hypothetical protein
MLEHHAPGQLTRQRKQANATQEAVINQPQIQEAQEQKTNGMKEHSCPYRPFFFT